MRIVGLDISTKSGWSHFNGSTLVAFVTLRLETNIEGFGPYPFCYDEASEAMAALLLAKCAEIQPHVIIIEETNMGRARYTQKILEFIHKAILRKLSQSGYPGQVLYVNSSGWRKALKIGMSKEDKGLNNKLSRAKSEAKHTGKKLDKAALGIKGKITKKHLALRWVNENYNLNLGMKDNDAADAICLVASYLANVPICDGKI